MLITAGTAEFGLRGFAAAQTSAIARRAGVSQPNVYANFVSKHELFLACLSTVAERLADVTPAQLLNDPGVEASRVTSRSTSTSSESRVESAARSAPQGIAEEAYRLSLPEARFVFQAVAAASANSEFEQHVRERLLAIENVLGEAAFNETLLRASRSLRGVV